jgi:hypothetical protein
MTPEQLQQRQEDVMRNGYFIARNGRMYPKGGNSKWIEHLTHILVEADLRKITLPMPGFTIYKSAVRAAELWDKMQLENGTYLLRFGKSDYMPAMHREGKIRISSAARYDDSSLNPAIRDDELEFTEESIGAKIHVPPSGDSTAPIGQWMTGSIIGTLKHKVSCNSEYYVACFGEQYDYRLFDDFVYDSCLVIRDPERFIDTIQQRSEAYLPGFQFCSLPVSYRDPFFPTGDNDVPFSKHFRYAYQHEFRIVWEPLTPMRKLPAVNLELGPLTDYCDLLVL